MVPVRTQDDFFTELSGASWISDALAVLLANEGIGLFCFTAPERQPRMS